MLILAGGDSKTVKGKVGIHRPYITELGMGGKNGAKTLGQYIDRIKKYLDKKGISPSLAEDMFSVSPEKIKYLSQAEIARYRLDQVNYLKQEQRDIEIANQMGLTRQQYIQRKIKMDNECSGIGNTEEMRNCINRTMGTNFK